MKSSGLTLVFLNVQKSGSKFPKGLSLGNRLKGRRCKGVDKALNSLMEARQNESPTLTHNLYTIHSTPFYTEKTFPRFLWRTFQKTAEMFHSNEKLSTFFKVLVENVYLLLTGHCRSEPYLSYQPIIFSLHIVCTF